MRHFRSVLALKLTGVSALTLASVAFAGDYEECLLTAVEHAADSESVAEIVKSCEAKKQLKDQSLEPSVRKCLLSGALSADQLLTAQTLKESCDLLRKNEPEVPERLVQEKLIENNPYVLAAHKRNFIMPATYVDEPNQAPYKSSQDLYPGITDPIQHGEVKMQMSLKVPLTYNDIFFSSDALYFGFTLKSFWQVYNHEISAPFRETNYNPEFFYDITFPTKDLNGIILTRYGLEHESNGRSQLLSRSWNRAYVMLGYGQSNWGISFRPWYRIPEDAKEDDGDPSTPPPAPGDDNPDIETYMGHFEVVGAYKHGKLEYNAMIRQNFNSGYGAYELSMSFPLWGRLRGYAEFFDGYGESLIDYNHRITRVGIGLLLTGIL